MPDQPARRAASTRPLDSSAYDDALYRALVERAEEYAGVVTDSQGRVVTWNRGVLLINFSSSPHFQFTSWTQQNDTHGIECSRSTASA